MKIRILREERGMNVSQLAELAECTPSFVSQIERSMANPSINTLKKFSKVLNVSLVEFFEDETSSVDVEKKYIVRKKQRKRFKSESEHTEICLLTPEHIESKNIEMHLMTLEPGGKSDKLYTNNAEEVGYILQGTLTFFLGEETFELNEGDSIYFPGDVPHGWENNTDSDVISLWAVTPSIFRTKNSLIIGETNYLAQS